MANTEHLNILKGGAENWNKWREENAKVHPSLADVKLQGVNLHGANLRDSDLRGASLTDVDFSEADLGNTNLFGSKIVDANLSRSNLNLSELSWANLHSVNLSGANLENSVLIETNFRSTILVGANLAGAYLKGTVFADVDLSTAQGLENVGHKGPSKIGLDTISRSKGQIPEVFLRGSGVADSVIGYVKALFSEPINFYSCFISYSNKDRPLAERLHSDLQSKGVRCWFAPADLKIGDKFRTQIDESIRAHDKLLLILSKDSLQSNWVETEIRTALERESRTKRTVLFPVRLDDSVFEARGAWTSQVLRSRQIGDFRRWNEQDAYQQAFSRLLRDLSVSIASEEIRQGAHL